MGANQEQQKKQERLVVEHFRALYADFPKGVLLMHESPDFVLRRRKGSQIGIELTSIKPVEGKDRLGTLIAYLREIIEIKNEKSLLYRTGLFEELWLIISSDFIDWPQSESPSGFLERYGVQSRFQRTFLFDLYKNQIFEL